MKITIQPQARVYTYKEMKEYLDEAIRQYRAKMVQELSRKKDVVADAVIYDELLTQEYVTLEALRRMGFQAGALEHYIEVKMAVADEINADILDYKDMEHGIDKLLGYHLSDPDLTRSLKERASE